MNITEMKLRPMAYDGIRDGKKTVEVRLFDEKRSSLLAGDLILFKKEPYLAEMLYCTVESIEKSDSLDEIYTKFGAESLGFKADASSADVIDAYGKIYSSDEIKKYGFCAIVLSHFDASALNISMTHARRINSRDVEIYFDGDFEFGKSPKADQFALTLDGKPLEIERWYGNDGRVHFCRMTTLRLHEALPTGDGTPAISVTYNGNTVSAPYEDYYKYYLTTKSGVTVKGSDKLILGMKTIERAGELVDIQLSASPEIAAQMVASGASLSVFGRGENAFHVPEHRSGYETGALYVEGFGGIACSITECNVWHWHRDNESRPDPEYSTHYHNENILIHEFGHGVKIAGIDRMEDRSLYTEFQMLYRHAKAAGRWPNTYAISNSDEYFATLSAIWFNVMNECAKDDGWDGTRGPINTRRELYNYDIDAYKFFSKIYPHRDLDGAWTPVPDTVHVTGLPDLPEEDFTGRNYTLRYPEAPVTGGIKFGDKYKISLPRDGLIIDTGASDGYTGIWYDYSGDTADMDSMTFIFEKTGDTVERVNEDEDEYETVYTVKIRNIRDGYLMNDGGRIRCGDSDSAAIFTITTIGTHPFAKIESDGKRLVIDGKPDMGTPVILTSDEKKRGGRWFIGNLADMAKRIAFIHDGLVNGSENGAVAVGGDTLTLSAAPEKDGGKFIGWRASHGDIADPASLETTMVMPAEDTVIFADYES